jgi:hypothetical protein
MAHQKKGININGADIGSTALALKGNIALSLVCGAYFSI